MKQLLSVSETAKVFGISRNRLYELVHSDPTLPALQIGVYKKINTVLFAEWLNQATREGRKL
ncbi:helix-turn-helix domain-containing protein [Alkalibaculum sp. M08DMB]|uniref:Helix-turn-helix domain-containing protein n=1 Tax=Alkalibaculum sporogenes TaxID=2655001 RepID=A0A6A7K9T5_9FIRM|nr:helix-turn-helix domain-containing protein [Alkalibaculum sporogenes]MPW26230.1 helix-turn-helix domain-containing protein [Alkalibaculum sporogenes]